MAYGHIITEDDFLKMYDEHSDALFRHCNLRIGNREVSKEMMCEAFKTLWLFVSRGNQIDSPKIFLYREINSQIQRRETEGSEVPSVGTSAFFRELPSAQRTVYLLHYIDGFSTGEIADIVGGREEEHGEALKNMRRSFPALAHV